MSELDEENNLPETETVPENLTSLFIIEDDYSEDDVKEHYKDIAVNAWESWHHYRGDMDKILYFGGTIFITIITTTSLVGLFGKEEITNAISVYQIILFHLIFFIIFLAHSYKRLISDVSLIFAKTSENYYQKRFNELLDTKFEFISIKNYFTKPGRLLLKTFNIGIIAIYILATSTPFIKINFDDKGFILSITGWQFIATLIAFIVVLLIVNRQTKREIRRVTNRIYRQFDNHLKEIERKNVS